MTLVVSGPATLAALQSGQLRGKAVVAIGTRS